MEPPRFCAASRCGRLPRTRPARHRPAPARVVRTVIDLIRDHPRAFPAVPGVEDGDLRRALIRRFGYWVVFEVFEEDDQVVVLSFWHGRQKSDGWR